MPLLVLLVSTPARAETYSNFRVVEEPKATKKGVGVKLCFWAEWPKNSKAANKGVEFALYPTVPGPGDIRKTRRECFTVKDVPTTGMMNLEIPFSALQAAKVKPGATVYLTGHWRNSAKAGVGATHVHGFDSREVSINVPGDLKIPTPKKNSAFRRRAMSRGFGFQAWPRSGRGARALRHRGWRASSR